MTDNAPAFSYQQVVQYAAKRRRTLKIDHPTATLDFITAVDGDYVNEGQVGVIQVFVPGKGTNEPDRFKCTARALTTKSFWRPDGPDAAKTYDSFKMLGFEPI